MKMNSTPPKSSGESEPRGHYDIGISLYEKYLQMQSANTKERKEKGRLTQKRSREMEWTMEALRSIAIEHLKRSLTDVDNGRQASKVHILLILTKLYFERGLKEDGESSFYDAVELERRYIGDNFLRESPHRERIIERYTTHIDPKFTGIFCTKRTSAVTETLEDILSGRIYKRTRDRLKKTEYINDYIKGEHLANEVLHKLKEMVGAIRLLIISENNDEIVTDFGFEKVEASTIKRAHTHGLHMTIDIFDKARKYTVMIDRGGDNSADQFKEYQLKGIINPMIAYFLTKIEQELFEKAYLNIEDIENIEKDMKMPTERHDYRPFIIETIKKCVNPEGFHEAQEDADYTDTLLKAMDICRYITLGYEDIPRVIDRILGGKIERNVLDMVKTLLLSRGEMMNGSGYPSGLSKGDIPLKGRIYQIIRSYEAFSFVKDPKDVMGYMLEGVQNGYLDGDILSVFSKYLDKEGVLPIVPDEPSDDVYPVSAYRRDKRYTPFVQLCQDILGKIRAIRQLYWDGRMKKIGAKAQNNIFKESEILHSKLLALADMVIKVIITRHGETESDIQCLPPGDEDEPLAQEGIKGSYEKGISLREEPLRIVASPLRRTQYTGAIICHAVRGCTRDILSAGETDSSYMLPGCETCPAVIAEDALKNPPKHLQNGRGVSLLQRFIADSADGNLKGLCEFVMKLVSSPKELTNLIITHGDIAVYLIILLENLFIQERLTGEKIPIKNNKTYTYTIRGGRLLSEKDEKTKGLLFSIDNRKSVISEINALMQNIYGETFHDPNQRIRLKSLHNRFLDFIDDKMEHDRKKLLLFIEQLGANQTTKYMIPILKAAGVTG